MNKINALHAYKLTKEASANCYKKRLRILFREVESNAKYGVGEMMTWGLTVRESKILKRLKYEVIDFPNYSIVRWVSFENAMRLEK